MKSEGLSEQQIREAITREGTIGKAALALGVSRQTVHKWINKYGITTERRTKAA